MLIDKLGKQQIIARNSSQGGGGYWLAKVNHRGARICRYHLLPAPDSPSSRFQFPILLLTSPLLSPTNSAPNPPPPVSKISSRWPGPHAHHLLLIRSGNFPGPLSALRRIRWVFGDSRARRFHDGLN